MANYLAHMQSKTPHERRQHALQVAGILTAFVFVVWITTLGIRFASISPQATSGNSAEQLANVAAAGNNGQATLIVATSTSPGQTTTGNYYQQ